MLSEAQHDAFDRLGVVRLSAAIAEADVLRMHDQLWEFLAARYGVRHDEPRAWNAEQSWRFQPLTRAGTFDAMGEGVLGAALDDLLGPGRWRRDPAWGRPLVTVPQQGSAWTVPSTSWHTDGPHDHTELPGVTVFAYLAPVLPGGGGTVVLTGSHRLAARHVAAAPSEGIVRSSDLKARLGAAHPWLRDLWSRTSTPDRVRRYVHEGADIDGIHLQVVELTGEPGDLVLMNPRLFHAPAPNVLATPRQMLVHIVGRS